MELLDNALYFGRNLTIFGQGLGLTKEDYDWYQIPHKDIVVSLPTLSNDCESINTKRVCDIYACFTSMHEGHDKP